MGATTVRRLKLLVATTSAGKLREWQALLGDLPLELLTLRDVGITFDVDETGSTYAANALLK
ncbi:MAG TPA: non-canonical purine NTP pyrophosphatase, partial [Chloroflexota bacterium]